MGKRSGELFILPLRWGWNLHHEAGGWHLLKLSHFPEVDRLRNRRRPYRSSWAHHISLASMLLWWGRWQERGEQDWVDVEMDCGVGCLGLWCLLCPHSEYGAEISISDLDRAFFAKSHKSQLNIIIVPALDLNVFSSKFWQEERPKIWLDWWKCLLKCFQNT